MDQTRTPLLDAAKEFLADPSITSFGTPGHKRSAHLADEFLSLDLPLFTGADDLHGSKDVLGQAQSLAAGLWECDFCRFCVNGSTQGNESLALAVARPGEAVVASRNMHKSVFAGIVLAGLEPVWVRPDIDAETGLPLRVPAERVQEALDRRPDVRAVFLVEPSYVGVISDVGAIAAEAHARGIPLVVDQAWGAHYGFHPDLPPSTLALGADGMVTSAHKTLASFTQGAYLFARGGLLDLERLGESFEALHTTSPSGALLASLDYARWVMAQRGEELLGKTISLARSARAALEQIDGLRILDGDDPTKLVFALAGTGADGLAVEADLFAQGIRFELANRDTIVAVFTIGDTEASMERLVEALARSIEERRGEPRGPGAATAVWSVEPEVAVSPREAFFAPRETVSADASDGRIAAEMVVPYPPGIPAIAPGEVVRAALVSALREAGAEGTRLAYCADPKLETIQVVARS